MAISSWFLRLERERPLMARTLIQRRHPSLVSSARAACSTRSRSAWRRASRPASVSRGRLEERGMLCSLPGLGSPGWRADPPPPARPPGRATLRMAVGRQPGSPALDHVVLLRFGARAAGLEGRALAGRLLLAGGDL